MSHSVQQFAATLEECVESDFQPDVLDRLQKSFRDCSGEDCLQDAWDSVETRGCVGDVGWDLMEPLLSVLDESCSDNITTKQNMCMKMLSTICEHCSPRETILTLLAALQRTVEQHPNRDVYCAACGETLNSKSRCGKCKSVFYCSRECQRADWKRHKHSCSSGQPPSSASSTAEYFTHLLSLLQSVLLSFPKLKRRRHLELIVPQLLAHLRLTRGVLAAGDQSTSVTETLGLVHQIAEWCQPLVVDIHSSDIPATDSPWASTPQGAAGVLGGLLLALLRIQSMTAAEAEARSESQTLSLITRLLPFCGVRCGGALGYLQERVSHGGVPSNHYDIEDEEDGCYSTLGFTPPHAAESKDLSDSRTSQPIAWPIFGCSVYVCLHLLPCMSQDGTLDTARLPRELAAVSLPTIAQAALPHMNVLMANSCPRLSALGRKLSGLLRHLPPAIWDSPSIEAPCGAWCCFQLLSTAVIHTPPDLKEERQRTLATIRSVMNGYTEGARISVLEAIVEQCPYAPIVALLLHFCKEQVAAAWKRPTTDPPSQLLSSRVPALVAAALHRTAERLAVFAEEPPSMLDAAAKALAELDVLSSALNFLRFLLLRDREDTTGVNRMAPELSRSFLEPLKQRLQRAQALVTAEGGPGAAVQDAHIAMVFDLLLRVSEIIEH